MTPDSLAIAALGAWCVAMSILAHWPAPRRHPVGPRDQP